MDVLAAAESAERKRSFRATRLELEGVASPEPYTRGTVLTLPERVVVRVGERLTTGSVIERERTSEGVITVEREELVLGVYPAVLLDPDPDRPDVDPDRPDLDPE